MTLRLRSSGQMPWWFGIPFVLGGLLFAGVGVTFLMDELRYGSEGVAVTGRVTDLDYSPASGDDGPSYTIRYGYTDAEGAERYGATDVDESAFDAATIGGPVEVTYLPAEPTKSRVGSPEPQLLFPVVFMAGGLLFAVVGVGLLALTRAIRRNALPSWVSYSTGSDADSDQAAALAQIFRGTALASVVSGEHPAAAVSAAPAAPVAPTPPATPLTEDELRALDARLAPPPNPLPQAPTPTGPGPGSERPPV